MPPADAKPTGRVAFDARGQAIWEWQIATGVYSRNPDAGKVPALGAMSDLSLAEPSEGAGSGVTRDSGLTAGDPRNQGVVPLQLAETPRKSLDDLRRLSEEIKRSRGPRTAS